MRTRSLRIGVVVALLCVAATACGPDDDSAGADGGVAAEAALSTSTSTPVGDSADTTDTSAPSSSATDADAPPPSSGAVEVALARLDGLDTIEGAAFSLAVPAGQPAVVWFWAPWCPNCRAMAPGLAELAQDFDGQITVLGVAGLGEVDEMVEFVDETGTAAIEHLVDPDGSVWSAFDVAYQPAFAFVTPDGEVDVLVGRQSQDTMVDRFNQLLGS